MLQRRAEEQKQLQQLAVLDVAVLLEHPVEGQLLDHLGAQVLQQPELLLRHLQQREELPVAAAQELRHEDLGLRLWRPARS